MSEDQKLLNELRENCEYYYTDLVSYVTWSSQNNYRWSSGRLPGGKTPEDVAQEIILKAISGVRKTYDPSKGSLRTWLHQQADSLIDALAKSAIHRKERELPEDELFVSDERDDPEQELLEKERWEMILKEVDVLLGVDDPDLKEIVEAIVFRDCEPKTRFLAKALGTDAKDIDKRLKRLRRLAKKGVLLPMNDESRKPPETEEDVFNVFVELFNQVAPETQEEIDEFLRENGYDPDELAKNASSIFQEAFEKSPLDWRNRARQEMADTKAKMAQYVPKSGRSREEVVADISSIQKRLGLDIAAHFRNFDVDKVSYEDLENMLAELRQLEADDSEMDER